MAAMFDALERETLILLGYTFLQAEKDERALVIFEALQEAFPGDPYVQKALAYLYLRRQRYAEALPLVRALLEAGANEPGEAANLLFMKAHALWGLEDNAALETAMAEFLQARSRLEPTP